MPLFLFGLGAGVASTLFVSNTSRNLTRLFIVGGLVVGVFVFRDELKGLVR